MRAVLFCLVMLAAAAASANDGNALDIQAKPFSEQAKAIRSELTSGDKYREISPEDRSRLVSLLDSMGSRIEEVGGADRLSPDTAADVLEEQKQVNTILARAADDSRVVCRREKRVGTNRATNICQTVAQRRRLRENTQRWGRDSGQHR